MADTLDTLNSQLAIQQLAADPLLVEACKARVFDFMEREGIAAIKWGFSGYGDSGDFESSPDMTLQDEDKHLDYRNHNRIWDLCEREMLGTQQLSSVMRDLVKFFEATCGHQVDWVNNDGGEGFVEFILDGDGENGDHYRRGVYVRVCERRTELYEYDFVVSGRIEPESRDENAGEAE